MITSKSESDTRTRLVGGAAAVVLVIAVLVVAQPGEVWRLLRTTDLGGLGLASLMAAMALVFRGIRLVLLLPPGRLGPQSATLIAATAQAAALFVPARVGELALPLLLRTNARWPLSAGVGTLLVARTFDVAALGVWAGASILFVWGFGRPVPLIASLLLVVPSLLLPGTLAACEWIALRTLAVRGSVGRRWTRRIRRTRRSVADVGQRPVRLIGAVIASLAMWAALWGLAWFLLLAMGHRWGFADVVAGSAAASLANLLPINFIGNLGTLEAGWTAAFVALGVPPGVAAATGFACHIWALIFAAAFGALAFGILSLLYRPGTSEKVMK